jgi:Protein of unknown function (DUF3341)
LKREPYGMMAAFASEQSYLAALRELEEAGFRRIETFTPYDVEAEEERVPRRPTPMGWIMLVAGLIGGGAAFFMQWYAARDYRLNVGGRPVDSWPAFVPVTFELTVLTAALTGVAALLWLSGLPRLDHPVFSDRRFRRASQDRFFVCVRADQVGYGEKEARAALLAAKPESVEEVFA